MVSKLEVGLPSGKLKLPPKSCMPRRAKMKTKRVRSRSSDRMELMAFISAITRLRRFVQYLVILNTLPKWRTSQCSPLLLLLAFCKAIREHS